MAETYIGHYGCPADGGRLVKIRTRARRDEKPRFSETVDVVDCPACGGGHQRVRPSWRPAHRGEVGRAEVAV